MSQIITITLNPALDKSIVVPELVPDKKLRAVSAEVDPGGGGINVSRALHKLGCASEAVFLSGGYTGKYLEELLLKEGVMMHPLPTKEPTRENFVVFDDEKKLQYRFGMEGPRVSEAEWKAVLDYTASRKGITYIVASGSLPPGVPVDFFGRLAAIAKNLRAKLFVDTSGEALKYAVKEGVYMIKPNLGELGSLYGKQKLSQEEIIAAAQKIITGGGCEVMVVSMGSAGAMLFTANEQYQAKPPKVTVLSNVGAGDSMVAGMICALSQGRSWKEILRYGVAAGTAATLHPGTELCKKEDTEQIFTLLNQD
ncbi:MAG: 1-phosphofructokinase family hexose kinase [Sphingobacteriia bacterium]|nr:1-phosphofructokinase family hexose kinase [Sphingobacteriia bacterium]